MNFIFVTDHLYLPERVGGRESSIHDLATRLAAEGSSVTVIGRSSGRSPIVTAAVEGWRPNYNVIRNNQYFQKAEQLLEADPRAVAIYSTSALAMHLSHRPSLARRQILYVRDGRELTHWGPETWPKKQRFIANSQFIADQIKKRTSIAATVIHPFIDVERVRTEVQPRFVTFVNPVPEKGLDLVLDLAARCPDIPFQIYEAWPLSTAKREQLARQLSPLSNVVLRPMTLEPRELYAEAAILLVPSQWDEGFGRVAVEAQINGIPVVGSRSGGLPEAVANGGVILDRKAPADEWEAVLRRIWQDTRYREELSSAALHNASLFEASGATATRRLIEACGFDERLHQPMIRIDAEKALYSVIVLGDLSDKRSTETVRNILGQSSKPASIILPAPSASSEERRVFSASLEGLLGETRLRFAEAGELASDFTGLFEALALVDTPFVSIARAGDLFEQEFGAVMVRAHLNPVSIAATATCDVGLYRNGRGPIALTTTGPRGKTVKQKLDAHPVHDFSYYEAPWLLEPSARSGPGLMFRTDVLRLLQGADTVSANPIAYCRVGAHLIGGGLHVSRTLAWQDVPPRGDPRYRPLISDYQKNEDVLTEALKDLAMRQMLRNGCAKLIHHDELIKMMKCHFKAETVLEMALGDEDLAAAILTVATT